MLKGLQTLRRQSASGTLCTVGEDKVKWKRIAIAVDSGACDTVVGPEELPAYEDRVRETKASINQVGFVAANGEEIPNYGELPVPFCTREGTSRGMVFQVAGVSKPLASVTKMNEAGHIVVFDGPESFIVNKITGEINALRQEDGNFMLDVWVPPPSIAEQAGFHGQP